MDTYEQKYREALKKAEAFYFSATTKPISEREVLANVFPELKESEDEKVRKKIIAAIDACLNIRPQLIEEVDYLQIKAWLEKQGENIEGERKVKDTTVIYHESGLKALEKSLEKGCTEGEQKPADKVEPKFKVGDWLQYRNAKPFFVEEITKQGYVNGDSCLPFNWENEIHLWTIQDAKDGDVLACGDKVTDCPFIFHNLTEELNPRSYCGVNTLGHFQDNDENGGFWCYSDKVRPATKEQRDLLFQKMKEEGYEWDAELKQLRKIGQKQEDESELSDFESALFTAFSYAWQKYLRGEEVNVKQWAKEYSKELLEVAKEELKEQKPAWSEEDEKMLKSLKTLLNNASCYLCTESTDKIISWLKSLRPQNTWKPSDEQMEALRIAGEIGSVNNSWAMGILKGMHQDLKKLKG